MPCASSHRTCATAAHYEMHVYRHRPRRDAAGEPARLVQRARLARFPAHQGAHQRHACRGRSRTRAASADRLRDLLTIFDEGGALVVCDDERSMRAGARVPLEGALLDAALARAARPCASSCSAMPRSSRHSSPGRASPARRSSLSPRRGRSDEQAARWLAALRPSAQRLATSRRCRYSATRAGPTTSARSSTTTSAISAAPAAVESRRESARQPPCRCGNAAGRKVRAPQSGMQGNALARRRDEEGHRDESLGALQVARGVKRGNLHPEQHQIGKRGGVSRCGRLGRGLRVGG